MTPPSEGAGAGVVPPFVGALGSAQAATGSTMLASCCGIGGGDWIIKKQSHAEASLEVGVSQGFHLRVEEGWRFWATAHGQSEAACGAQRGAEGLSRCELNRISMMFLSFDRLMVGGVSLPASWVQWDLGLGV